MTNLKDEEFRRSQRSRLFAGSQPVLPYSPVIFASFHHGKEERASPTADSVKAGFRVVARNDKRSKVPARVLDGFVFDADEVADSCCNDVQAEPDKDK